MTVRDKIRTLKSSPFFAGVSDAKLRRLLSRITVVEYEKGEVIFDEGSLGEGFYIIYRGKVRLESRLRGRRKIITYVGEGEILGEMAIIDEAGRSATAVSHETVSLMRMSSGAFIQFLEHNPRVAVRILETLSSRLRALDEEISNITFNKLPARLLLTLKALYRKFPGRDGQGDFIDTTVTHKELADILGTSRESVTKIVSDLRRAGKIDVIENRIYMVNP